MKKENKIRYLIDNGPVNTSINFDCCVVCSIFKDFAHGIGVYEKGEALLEYFPTHMDCFVDIVTKIVSVRGGKDTIINAEVVEPAIAPLVEYVRNTTIF